MKNLQSSLLWVVLLLCFIYEPGYSSAHLPLSNKQLFPKNNLVIPHSNTPLAAVSLEADLYAVNADNSVSLEDGSTDLFDPSYCNCVNWLEDVKKMSNMLENFSLTRSGQLMAIEKQQPVAIGDTINFSMSQMQHKNYELVFVAKGLTQPNLYGYVQDIYAGTSTPMSLSGNTYVPFVVTTDPNSGRSDRFRIVFTNAVPAPNPPSTVTPVTYKSVTALQGNNGVAVQWQVTNEQNVAGYKVEKSSDGIEFTSIAAIAPSGKSSSIYNWLDAAVAIGVNYYRIEEIDNNGTINYSQVIEVSVTKGSSSISVYPNPVVSGVIGLQMNNMTSGNYNIRLINNFGQTVFSSRINHNEGNATESISVGSNIIKGVYRLIIIHPDNSESATTVVF